MARHTEDGVVVAAQTSAIGAMVLSGAAVVVLLGVIMSVEPLALNATLAPIVFAVACTGVACALVWRQVHRAVHAYGELEDARVRERILMGVNFDALLTLDARGVVETLNLAGERMFGLSQVAAVGRDFRTLVDLESGSGSGFFEIVTLGGARRAATPRRAIGQRVDGARFEVEIAFADLPTAAGVRVLALVRDLSSTARPTVDERPACLERDEARPLAPLQAAGPSDTPVEPACATVDEASAASSPLVLETAMSTLEPIATAPSSKPPLRVLICDDDPELCTVLEALLRAYGTHTHVVHDIDGAVAALVAGRFDVMLLDLQLGGGDGLDVLRTLPSPQSAPLSQVILLSSDASMLIDGDEFPVELVERMEKPVRLDLLRRAVQAAMARASTARDEARPIILHVDDDPDIRRLVRDLLAPTGEVIAVATLFEAKRKLSAVDPDLVVLDIGLRDGSGLELMPLLTNSAGDRIPTIVFSGRTLDANQSDGKIRVFAKSCASFEALAVEAGRLVASSGAGERAQAA